MSSRYKDWQSQSSSLPRRYYSLPRDYSSQDSGSCMKDSTSLSRHRTSSASGTTPATQSWRYVGSRTFGSSSGTSSTSDIKAPATRRAGSSAVSSLGTSNYARKGSFSRDKGGSLPSSPTRTKEISALYSARHVASLPLRNSVSQKSSWGPDSPPLRQRSSSSLRESYSWDPGSAPVRQHSSSSLRDKPFGLTNSRRKYSSSKDYSSDDAHRTARRMPSPQETTSKRPTSPSAVYYEGSQLISETPTSPDPPTALRHFGGVSCQGPVSSKSDVNPRGASSSSSQQNQGVASNNVDLEDACTARDISLISRQIASAYEGSLSRSDSRKGRNLLLAKEERSPQKEIKVETVEKLPSKDVTKKEKEGGKTTALGRGRKSPRRKSPDSDLDAESHRRSSSVGSTTSKDEGKTKSDKHFGMKSGFFSRKKSRDSTDSEGEEDKKQRKGKGLFPRKKSGDSVKDSQTQQGSTSSSPSLSPTLTPPRRKISGPSRFFFSSGDSKTTTSDVPRKKFSVPGKYFPSKDSKSGGESSDNMEPEPGRLSRQPLRRRVSFPGMRGFPKRSSIEHIPVSPESLIDPELLNRRRNMKKALSFDSSKMSVLHKLRFWDKSPDSRRSTSPDDDRSRLQSLVGEASVEKRTSRLRKSRERMARTKPSEEKETLEEHSVRSEKDKPEMGPLSLSEIPQGSQIETVPFCDAPAGSVQKPSKEPKVRYVGSTEPPLPSELRAKRRTQYKVNSVDNESQLSCVSATEQKANCTNSDTVKRDSDKPINLEDTSTRDTVSKLRERRRRRKEERERFFAGLIPTLENNTTKDATFGNETVKEPNINKTSEAKSPVVAPDAVDGKLQSDEKKLVERNGLIRSKCIANDTSVRRTPQLGDIGKKYTVDDMSNRERTKSGKPRYQTIASSVHADIIADLIRERGLKTVDAEVKIPSVAELRAKFLISKDDNKIIPPRPVIRLEDRPHSICGEVLSPTEMRKFDEVNFSLAKRVSSDKINVQNCSDSSTASLSTVVAESNQQGLSSSPKIESVKKEVKVHNKIQEEELDKGQQDLSPESEIKKKRGSKKKRKKSLFGGDKEAKVLEEENDMPQTGPVSAAIKAMFLRRGSVDKSKISRKQRSRTLGSVGQAEAEKASISAKERKKSLPEHVAAKSSAVNESRMNAIPKKEVKHERIGESREYGKEKGAENNILGKDKEVERKVHGKDKNLERKTHTKDGDMERKVHSKDKDIGSKVSPKDKDIERKLSSKNKEIERKGSTEDKDIERKGSADKCIVGKVVTNDTTVVRKVSAKDKDVELQPIKDVEIEVEKTAVKEKKSLKKSSKNKKRKFSSSLKPFSMIKTKSESNLAQRFDFLTVDIPLEDEQLEKQDKGEKEQFMREQVCDKPALQVVAPPQVSKERRPSVFEEGLREFYDVKADQRGHDLVTPPEPCKFEITLEDLDAISEQTSGQLTSLAENRMKIKPRRHHRTKSNPVKSLQNRDDIRTDTEVDKPRIEKKPVTSEHPVIRRKKKKYKDPDNLYRRHTLDLAASALAGLASTEDFTKVLLRKTAGPNEKDEFRGTKPTMLIHIKGRRHLQVRLTEPCQKSLNSGDCFALVTEKDLFSWIGKDCNPYEKAKVTEIVSKIKTKSELDCKARDIVTIEEGDEDNNATLDKFWKILSGDTDAKIKDAQSLPTDEEYEKGVVKGNMVYKIHWTDPPSLMPIESMCGHLPQVSILDTKEVFVFDFGSELYVWNGQQSLSGQRKSAFALARQLYEEPFKPYRNYNPIFPYGNADNTIIEVDNKNTSKRPPWTLFARLHEKAETILFREKFLDWPDPTKIIKMKGHPSCLELAPKPSPPVELKPYDVKKMMQEPSPLQCPTFEGVNVGRGNGVPTVWVGDVYREGNLVTTVGLTVWHINEYRHFELPSSHFGHFHSGEGYVVRWAYFVLADRVVKDRKSRCRSTVAGRVRCAYFFWQGNDCSVNEKGAAAIMAVELDEEKGPQVRVVQGKESPVFLSLFKGGMIIHNGSVPKSWYDPEKKKVDDTAVTFSDTSTIRLFVTRNEEPGEACVNQVKANSYSLRSRTSFILLLCRKGHIYLWHGSKSSEDSRSTARTAAKLMQERKSVECNVANVSAITMAEIEEGNEPDEFWQVLGGKKYYCSLANDPSKHHYQPRLFEMSSATGIFSASEVLCPARSEPKICPFPFLQEDLCFAKQPGLFIVDGYYEVYVWEGWMLENDDDVRTGSGRQRWDRDRRLAMQTALHYAKEVGKRVSHRVYVVFAGLEPQSFKALFPYWNDLPDVARIQKQDGKQPNAKQLASDLLEQFTKEFYTLEELKKIPPPQGVDPAKLEAYLNDSDFMDIFKMEKEDFNKLPVWKQQNLKRPVGLF